MTDWKAKLEGLNKELQSREQAREAAKANLLAAFRKRLLDVEPILKNATEFGDAFGADCQWEVSRFDQRYPYFRFVVRRPLLRYEVRCQGGELRESLQEGEEPVTERTISLEELAPKRLEQRLTVWVQGAAQANRKFK